MCVWRSTVHWCFTHTPTPHLHRHRYRWSSHPWNRWRRDRWEKKKHLEKPNARTWPNPRIKGFEKNKMVLVGTTPHPGCQSPPGLWTIFSRESRNKPSFVTVTGWGVNQRFWFLCEFFGGVHTGLNRNLLAVRLFCWVEQLFDFGLFLKKDSASTEFTLEMSLFKRTKTCEFKEVFCRTHTRNFNEKTSKCTWKWSVPPWVEEMAKERSEQQEKLDSAHF